MLGDGGEQQEEDCYHGDEDASLDPWNVETGSHGKRIHSTHTTTITDQRVYAQWPSSLVWTFQIRDPKNFTRRVMDQAIPDRPTIRRGRLWHH